MTQITANIWSNVIKTKWYILNRLIFENSAVDKRVLDKWTILVNTYTQIESTVVWLIRPAFGQAKRVIKVVSL